MARSYPQGRIGHLLNALGVGLKLAMTVWDEHPRVDFANPRRIMLEWILYAALPRYLPSD